MFVFDKLSLRPCSAKNGPSDRYRVLAVLKAVGWVNVPLLQSHRVGSPDVRFSGRSSPIGQNILFRPLHAVEVTGNVTHKDWSGRVPSSVGVDNCEIVPASFDSRPDIDAGATAVNTFPVVGSTCDGGHNNEVANSLVSSKHTRPSETPPGYSQYASSAFNLSSGRSASATVSELLDPPSIEVDKLNLSNYAPRSVPTELPKPLCKDASDISAKEHTSVLQPFSHLIRDDPARGFPGSPADLTR